MRVKKVLFIAALLFFSFNLPAQTVKAGAELTGAYLPLIRGKRVAVMTNQTGRVGDEHLVDLLIRNKVDLVGIFSPSTGFVERPMRGSTWQARWMRKREFLYGRFTVVEAVSHLPIK